MFDGTCEMWKPVAEYQHYWVSDRGRVMSTPRNTTSGGLLKLKIDQFGYRLATLSQDGKERTFRAHQLVLEAFDPDNRGPIVRHLNGDPSDNRWPENICWGTQKENAEDRIRHGRQYQLYKTHCPQGHPYDAENTRYGSKGERICKICYRIACREGMRRYRARLRELGREGYLPEPTLSD